MGPADVAIVGGGASGTLVAVQLLRQARGPLRVALVERSGALARGLAYGPAEPCHVLNVPAGRMSALPEDPDHFVRWCGAGPDEFVGRATYGAYLEALLSEARAGAAPGVVLFAVPADVVRASVGDQDVRLVLRGGGELDARTTVLALGNFASPELQVPDGGLYLSALYRRSPWEPGALDGIDPEAPVLLLGTGLTMVDAALSLRRRGHRGPIEALSRHGLLPHVHTDAEPSPVRIGAAGLRGLLRALRAAARREPDWRSAFDTLRPVTQRIWIRLPLAEKRRFLRHLRTFWDVHRHRMAPVVADAIAHLRGRGQLRVHAGRVHSFALTDGIALARFRPRGERLLQKLHAALIVNCTGPAAHLSEVQHPLVASLLEQGLARADVLGMGFLTDAGGSLLGGGNGQLFTLGTLRRGELWETTAMPELREQARALAERLVRELGQPSELAAEA